MPSLERSGAMGLGNRSRRDGSGGDSASPAWPVEWRSVNFDATCDLSLGFVSLSTGP